MRRLVMVSFFLEVGLLLIVLPWSSFWERNYFAVVWPLMRTLVTNNFVRGAVSGLGVVNVVAGFAELMPIFGPRERHDLSLTRRPTADPRYATHPDTQVDR
jgi:hypothetical protein